MNFAKKEDEENGEEKREGEKKVIELFKVLLRFITGGEFISAKSFAKTEKEAN